MKIKNINFTKYKIKKFIFFQSKLEQEIKIRKKNGKIRKNPEIPQKKSHKSFQKSFIF